MVSDQEDHQDVHQDEPREPLARGVYEVYSEDDGSYSLVISDATTEKITRHVIPARMVKMASMAGVNIGAFFGGK